MQNIKQELQTKIAEALKKEFSIDLNANEVHLEHPADNTHGDWSTNVAMTLAKQLGMNPMVIAKKIVEGLSLVEHTYLEVGGDLKSGSAVMKKEGAVSVGYVKPGFINFYAKSEVYIPILEEITTKKDHYGANKIGEGKNVIVEFSSPNIAKPFTIGHLRSTIIGDSIARILDFSGYKVFKDNHLGDWGASFGKYLAAFEYYENIDIEAIKGSSHPVKELVDIYIRFNADIEKHPELEDLSREWFKKLEEGDGKARQLWQECIDITFVEFDRIYEELGIEFTENDKRGYGEAYFEKMMPALIKDLEEAAKNGVLDYRKSEGAMLVFFPKDELPPLMILKSNGTTLYSTRDLTTDKFRMERKEYGYPNLTVINEVGADQVLYWKQIFKIEELLGWYKPGQRVHVGHGFYRFKEGKMSTRKGNVIWLEEVLNEAEKRAFNMAFAKLDSGPEGDEWVTQAKEGEHVTDSKLFVRTGERINNSKAIGIGALKWNDLKRDPKQDIVFDWDEILSLKGNSSPYIQYTYVRANKIGKTENMDFANVELNAEEGRLLSLLSQFSEVVEAAARLYQTSLICNYLFELAQSYSLFYEKHRILDVEDAKVKNLRIAISQATAQVLKNGLYLLGIETVDRM